MAALQSTQLSGSIPNYSHGLGGNLKNALATVTVPVGTAAGDTAAFFDLPAGARVIGLTLTNPTAVGAALTMNIGDAGSATRYLAATSLNSAVVTSSATAAGIGFLNTAVTRVQGVFAGVTSVTASTIIVCMQFIVEGVAS